MSLSDPRRRTPRMDVTLAHALVIDAASRYGELHVRTAALRALDACRQGVIKPEDVVHRALQILDKPRRAMRSVVNATGVIVHTNLGRASLSEEAIAAVVDASGPVDVEMDLESGKRASRGRYVIDALLERVPKAEDAHVANSGAAAVALVAAVVAPRRHVVVARSEMVEIGDGFRLHELVAAAGSVVHEVGATNRVYLADYEDALGPSTGFVLKVHPSNYVIAGYTISTTVRELATLPVPVVVDIGSGLLEPHTKLPYEPDASSELPAQPGFCASGYHRTDLVYQGYDVNHERFYKNYNQRPYSCKDKNAWVWHISDNPAAPNPADKRCSDGKYRLEFASSTGGWHYSVCRVYL